MSSSGGWKGIVKNGWHPEKEGTTLKGQVKGLIGKGVSSSPRNEGHVAAPISSLRDPSSFGPPPKKNPGGFGNISSNEAVPSYSTASSAPYAPSPTNYEGQGQQYGQVSQPLEEAPAEPRPYRVNTSGLSTSNLPPPPMRRDGADGRAPLPAPPPKPSSTSTTKVVPPSLPPRLPPRSTGNSPSPTRSTGHEDSSSGILNQSAVDRLGAAGISVAGFGIGTGKIASQSSTSSQTQSMSGGVEGSSALGKKKPPPPVAKKPILGHPGEGGAPPPVPLATRPQLH
ncbi:hypothetical protein F5Y16DRAFT_396453 [Xylariaceae sp. FL0255]|nr:hypothetical protein F5Y16DRAFT_396453 [Xylariaceae sp. FL0255]